jgi:hypothetical protein
VGGDDLAIMVVAPPPSDGARATLVAELMKDVPFAKDTRVVNTGPDVNRIVCQVPGAFSFPAVVNKSDNIKLIQDDKGYVMKDNLVTKGPVTDAEKRLISAVSDALLDQ